MGNNISILNSQKQHVSFQKDISFSDIKIFLLGDIILNRFLFRVNKLKNL